MSSDQFPGTVRGGDAVFDTRAAHQARSYNYLLGGKDNFAADREYAEAVTAVYPSMTEMASANRDFLGRAVRFLAGEAGVSQFLDIGTGIPAPGSTHEVAQELRPGSRIVYVDNDPVVLAHARALLTGPPGTMAYLDADLREPGHILSRAADTLDFGKPIGLLLIGILHAIGDADDPWRIVSTLVDALPASSYLAITHWATDTESPASEAKVMDLTREMSHQQYTPRGEADVARFFDGLSMVEPGLVQPQEWHPAPGDHPVDRTLGWAGIARKY